MIFKVGVYSKQMALFPAKSLSLLTYVYVDFGQKRGFQKNRPN